MSGDSAAADDMRALRSAIGDTEVIIAGVPAGLWDAPTPCTGVDVRALVNHLVTGNLYFASLVSGRPVPDGDEDHLGADPAGAFRAASVGLVAALDASGVLDRTYRLPVGQVPGHALIEIRLIEHLGHGWDVAKATGQAAPFREDVAERGLAIARRQLRSRPEGAFGPEVKVPEDAAAIDRLAGILGRRA